MPAASHADPLKHGAGELPPTSVPGSRSASPPIRLPPLKLLSSPSSPQKRADAVADGGARRRSLDGAEAGAPEREGKQKVELPGFSAFAAASGLGA